MEKVVLVCFILVFSLMATPEGWEYNITGSNHTFIFFIESNPNIGNQLLEDGDYIGGFYTDNNGDKKCGGYGEWQGNWNNLGITIFGNDNQSSTKNGFDYGEEVEWRIYRISTGEEFVAISSYIDPYLYPFLYLTAEGSYVNDGLSMLDKLDTETTTNLKPIVDIPDQQSSQVTPFQLLDLDLYVEDDNTTDEDIRWFIDPNYNPINYDLLIVDRVLEIVPKDPLWFGNERVRLLAMDQDNFYGSSYFTISVVESTNVDEDITPTVVEVGQNYPNPFNPDTTIPIKLQKGAHLKCEIYNLKGEVVKTIFNGYKGVGTHFVTWNGLDNKGVVLGSGVYLVRVETPISSDLRNITFIR